MVSQNIPPKHQSGSPAWWANRLSSDVIPADPSVGRPPVPLERMLTAAIQLIDEAGPASLSLRQLAERIGSSTATLYRHFASKDEILACVVDRILGEVEIDSTLVKAMSWQQAWMYLATALCEVLKNHPGVVSLLASQIPVGPNALAQREKAIAFLLVNGFSARLAARGYSASMHYVIGFASQLPTPSLSPTANTDLRDFYKKLNKKNYPAMTLVAEHLPMISNEEEFHFGLALIVDGLARARDEVT